MEILKEREMGFWGLYIKICWMKHSNSLRHFHKFVYVDSSEEEEETREHGKSQPRGPSDLLQTDNNLHQDDLVYKQQIKGLIQGQIDKIVGGRILLVGADDKLVEQNFKMRKQKYEYFKQQMQIDERYNRLMQEKVSKLKEENQRKKEILEWKRKEEKMREEEDLLRKHIIQKRSKQERVINGAKKLVHKLGVERTVHLTQNIKSQIQTEKELTEQQLQNLKAKQKNELSELREKYEQAKAQKRLNKLQQQKVLRDLQRQNKQRKQQLKAQLLIKQFKV